MSSQRVLVTGASKGIGRAIAARLAKDGWNVAIHYGQDLSGANELSAELGERSAGVYGCNLAQPALIPALVKQVLADGPIHALVNNAGVYEALDFAGATDDQFAASFSQTMTVNFESPVQLIRAFLPTFVKAGEGKILNVASRVGFKGEGGAALYAASKGALIALTRSLAVELAPKNVGIFGIAPGWVGTDRIEESLSHRLKEVLSTIPLGRIATPQDCAACASFLLSPSAAYLSGMFIDINGASYFH